MKKLSTISLFIFGAVVTAILTASLIYYQNNKSGGQVSNSQISSLVQNTLKQLKSSGVVLDMTEIIKHNKQTDCWMLISGKIYDITSFFGSHPGGNNVMISSCGKDATDAYKTKDPNATSTSGGRGGHSFNAQNLLSEYYLGDFNQTVK